MDKTSIESTRPEGVPQRLGDFEIVRELGRGGMGVVYEAQQRSLNRRVALKVLSSGLGLTTEAIVRFKREAEAAGKLHHTNIVPIYSTGEENRIPYYAMELVDGPSIDRVIRFLRQQQRPKATSDSPESRDVVDQELSSLPDWAANTILQPADCADGESNDQQSSATLSDSSSSFGSGSTYFDNVARMISEVADALAHAHDHGVIHRDMKPSNLLLSPDGRLSINDFGLARMLEQPGMTISGELMGSPMYMSPEQIAVGRIPLDHRTDIYSLGAVLYELITLQPPFEGQQRDQVLSQIIHKEPTRPRSIDKKIPQDLETICLKAMEKDPDRRYQTANQMAEDLKSFVNRLAISARRIGPVERCMRWVKRHRALSAAIACAVMLGIVALFVTVRAYRDRQQNIEAMKKIQREQAMNDALMAAMSGNIEEALEKIHEAEILDAPVAWQHMLLGQVALFEGKQKEALERFEDAIKLDPDNIVAKSMLAQGYLENGRWFDFMSMASEIEKLQGDIEKRTPEELVFMSMAVFFVDPENALRMMEKAIESRSSFPLARIQRAALWTLHAMDRRDVELAVRALDELNLLVRFHQDLRDNPSLRNGRLHTGLALASLYRSLGDSDEVKKILNEAKPDVDFLRNNSSGYLSGNANRLHYYGMKWDLDRLESNLDAMAMVMQHAEKYNNVGWIVDCYWTTFFRAGGKRIEEALDQLGRMSNQDDHIAWGRIVLLMENGDRDTANRIHKEMKGRSLNSSTSFDIGSEFFLPGQLDDKLNYARIRDQGIAKTSNTKTRRDTLQYLTGEITKDELISRIGESERRKSEVYFSIGMRQLAEGRRSDAKKSFQLSADSPVFGWSARLWARAFLDRMNKDKNWPDWLPSETDSKTK